MEEIFIRLWPYQISTATKDEPVVDPELAPLMSIMEEAIGEIALQRPKGRSHPACPTSRTEGNLRRTSCTRPAAMHTASNRQFGIHAGAVGKPEPWMIRWSVSGPKGVPQPRTTHQPRTWGPSPRSPAAKATRA